MQDIQSRSNVCYANGAIQKHLSLQLIRILRIRSGDAFSPANRSELAAGYDLYAAEAAVVPARGIVGVPTGIAVAIPYGTYGRVAPRSGLAAKHSIDTAAGVVDADYRGEIKVLLFNHSDTDYPIAAGDRIAQFILEKIVPDAEVLEADSLPESVRGAGGFGSTGK
ncbi:hypothetical protein CANCADRAFT_57466 [Tortispora caseinolytica NRRL Y-17796]|uniref:Deoxyuridine 5'-triphosphate nucleotidohydrolase n=1 Tax=Tortispora caseinolytica NRRL Y-17796 TaxID=767744 RepID=A0A1E4THA0_9ASCO|nr:hypothetical protein CANCADRAFT_57466 [Tortispora caseinolytica NRRL Y-17796]